MVSVLNTSQLVFMDRVVGELAQGRTENSNELLILLVDSIKRINFLLPQMEERKEAQVKEIVGAVTFLKDMVEKTQSNDQAQAEQTQPQHVEHAQAALKGCTAKAEFKECPKTTRPAVCLETYADDAAVRMLQEWTGKEEARVVYDSEVDGLSGCNILQAVGGKTDVMVVVETSDGSVFGTFNGAPIPVPQAPGDYCFVRNDERFFVFTLKNPHNTPPLCMRKRPETSTASVMTKHGAEDVWYVCGAFSVRANHGSFVLPSFGETYDAPAAHGADLLVGTHDPDKFEVRRVAAFLWR